MEVEIMKKGVFRCRRHEQQIRYRVDCFGNSTAGWKFYDKQEVSVIEATLMTYLSIDLVR